MSKLYYNFRYKTPKDAEAWCCGQSVPNAIMQASVSHTVQSESIQTTPVDLALVQYMFNQLQAECQLAALSELFSSYMNQFALAVPNDFLSNAANAMVQLSDAGRTNILYNLAKGIGTSLVPRPLFFFLCGGGEKKGLVDLQYIFCAAGSTTIGDRLLVVMNSKGLLTKQQ